MAEQSLGGKVAVVTGAAQGIGARTAQTLAERGAAVAVVDLNAEAATATATTITEAGGRALPVSCDVSQRQQVTAAFEKINSELGPVGILVNNAGVTRDNMLFKMSDEDWDMVLGVHLRGAFLCSQAAQASMVQQKWGKIVNLSSVSALGNRGQANYSAAKAGMQGFTKTLAAELGKFGVNVNSVAPGFVVSEMTRATAERVGVDFEQLQQGAAEASPLQRVGYPEDIANAIGFLVSEEAAFITGQVLYVDGGRKS